jgi:isopenicillin-N epimerase
MKDLFLLRKDRVFLNFGSFGATPIPIFDAYQDFQRQLEAEPVQFIVNQGPKLLIESRNALSNFLHCQSQDLIFVPNPTYAVNCIAKSLDLKENDEVLTTNLEYGACDRTWEYYCEKVGANYVKQVIELPLVSKDQFLEQFWKGCTQQTRLIFISHITSVTALILPVKEICAEAHKRGIPVFVDGAHVPGHIPLNIAELEVDYYTGACHKWMMTPKGSSFMYVRSGLQEPIDPLIISWGYKADFPTESQYFDYHQFNGTRDFSAYLTIPAALEFMEKHQWEIQKKVCREQVLGWTKRLCKLLKTSPLAPLSTEFFGQMASIPIQTPDPIRLKQMLYEDFGIEIPIPVQHNKAYIRFSFQAFNSNEDMEKLETALKQLIDMKLISQ